MRPRGTVLSLLTRIGFVRVESMTLLALTLPLAEVDAAEEGRKIITGMLLVGLTFLAVILLGELLEHRGRKRR